MFLRIIVLCLLTATAANLAAMDEASAPARSQLDRFSAGLEGLHATFEQVVKGPDGQVEDTGRGEVWLARPDLFCWEYQGEFPERIVADGRHVWIYDESLEQVTVKPQSALADDSPLGLLTDPAAIDERFSVRELGENEGLALLELESVTEEAEFERVLLGLTGDELRLMIMEDAFGLRTEIRFTTVQRNPQIEQERFHFEPPAGVDVVGDPASGTED